MSDWYTEWATRHAKVFGLVNDLDMATIFAWRQSFEAAEYTGSELQAATDWIAENPETLSGFTGKMTGHLTAIRKSITEQRSVRFDDRWNSAEQDRGTCVECGGSGRGIVPHLDGVKDGAWMPQKRARANATYYTMAVICSCIRGRLMLERLQETSKRLEKAGKRRFLVLSEYGAKNPQWRTQMEWREREMSERAKLDPEKCDTKLRAALDRLISQNESEERAQ